MSLQTHSLRFFCMFMQRKLIPNLVLILILSAPLSAMYVIADDLNTWASSMHNEPEEEQEESESEDIPNTQEESHKEIEPKPHYTNIDESPISVMDLPPPQVHTLKSADISEQAQSTYQKYTELDETFEGPVVHLLQSHDPGTGKEIITVEENRLRLNAEGKLDVLIDTSYLKPELREDGFLQLALRFRRGIDNGWHQPLVQQTASIPYAKNQYRLQIDLCPKNDCPNIAGKMISLYIHEEKDYRPLASQIGSALAYLIMSWSFSRVAHVPNGDNAGFGDTIAAGLPAATVLNGMDQLTELLERSDILTSYAPCVSAVASRAAMGLSRDFTANTEELFVFDGVRHYARSGTYTQWYKCLKAILEDNALYPQRNYKIASSEGLNFSRKNDHNVTKRQSNADNPFTAKDPTTEFHAALLSSIVSASFMLTADNLYSSTISNLERDKQKAPKAEHINWGGLELRGGAASSPYRVWDTVQMGITKGNEPVSSWDASANAGSRLFYKGIEYSIAASLYFLGAYWTYSTELNSNKLKKNKQMLTPGFLHAVNMMELGSFILAYEVQQQISQPVANMLTNAMIKQEWIKEGSTGHTIVSGVNQVLIHGSISFTGIEIARLFGYQYNTLVTNTMTKSAKNLLESKNLLIDIMVGTTVNGMALPFVLMIDDHLMIPFFNEGSTYLCRATDMGIFCPGHEASIGITGSSGKETHIRMIVPREPIH